VCAGQCRRRCSVCVRDSVGGRGVRVWESVGGVECVCVGQCRRAWSVCAV